MTHLLHTPPNLRPEAKGGGTDGGRQEMRRQCLPLIELKERLAERFAAQPSTTLIRKTQAVLLAIARSAHSCRIHARNIVSHLPIIPRLIHATDIQVLESQAHSRLLTRIGSNHRLIQVASHRYWEPKAVEGETRGRHHLTGSAWLIHSSCCWAVAPQTSARWPTEPCVDPWPQSMHAVIITLPWASRGESVGFWTF